MKNNEKKMKKNMGLPGYGVTGLPGYGVARLRE